MNPTSLVERDLSWFAQRVLRGQTEIFSEIVTLTPAIAHHILENNPSNRSIDQRIVDRMARDMRESRWQLNGETIVIARTGELNDGQHRLWAIIEADLPVQCVMTFGVTRSSRLTVDSGRVRSFANYVGMDGGKNSTHMARTVTLWLTWSKGLTDKAAKVNAFSKAELMEVYQSRRVKFDHALEVALVLRKIAQPSVFATAYAILWEADSIHVDGFFTMLNEGSNLDRDDPILVLRNRLTTGAPLTGLEKLELILRHWNAWKEGKRLSKAMPILGSWPAVVHRDGRKHSN